MPCTRCGSASRCHIGLMRGKQRDRCRACDDKYTGGAGMAYPDEQQQLALPLYLEGRELGAIGRVLDGSNGTGLPWVRAYGQRAEQQAAQAPAQAVRSSCAQRRSGRVAPLRGAEKTACWV